MNLEEPNYPPQKLTLLLKNRASKKKEASIPSIHFQVRTVSFRESLSFSFIFNFQIEVWTWPAAKTTKGTEGIWEKLSSHSLGPQLLCQKKTPGSCLDTATGGIWSLAPRNTKKHSLKRLKNVKKMEGDHSDTKFQKKKKKRDFHRSCWSAPSCWDLGWFLMQNFLRLLWWATCTFQRATGSHEPGPPIPSTVFGWMSNRNKCVEDSGRGNEQKYRVHQN